MTLKEYQSDLMESLYFGPWSNCNPEKAIVLIKMAEMELSPSELADVYSTYVYICFDSSVKYGDGSRDYYEKAMTIFDKLIGLLNHQDTNDLFIQVTSKVEDTINLASQATGWASGYDSYMAEQWYDCVWYVEEKAFKNSHLC